MRSPVAPDGRNALFTLCLKERAQVFNCFWATASSALLVATDSTVAPVDFAAWNKASSSPFDRALRVPAVAVCKVEGYRSVQSLFGSIL